MDLSRCVSEEPSKGGAQFRQALITPTPKESADENAGAAFSSFRRRAVLQGLPQRNGGH